MHSILRKSLVLGTVVVMVGCQTGNRMSPNQLHTERFPQIGNLASAEIGETVLERTQGMGSPGFQISDLEFEQSGYRFFMPGQTYKIDYVNQNGKSFAYGFGEVRSRTEGFSVSGSNYQLTSTPNENGCTLEMNTLSLSDRQGHYVQNWTDTAPDEDSEKDADVDIGIGGRTILAGTLPSNKNQLFAVSISESKCVKRFKFADYGNTFRQELIYLGRSGDELSFKYREFSGNLARPAFSADLKYDLSDSEVLGYRGARIEVIDAGNQEIQYRVQQHITGM